MKLNHLLLSKTEGLLDESNKTKKVQKETISYILGTAEPKLDLMNLVKNQFVFKFSSNSDYPIYDLLVKIENYDEIIKCPFTKNNEQIIFDTECLEKNSVEFAPFFLSQNTSRLLGATVIADEETRHISIQWTANRFDARRISA